MQPMEKLMYEVKLGTHRVTAVLESPGILPIFSKCPGLSWKVNLSENFFINRVYHYHTAFYYFTMQYVFTCNFNQICLLFVNVLRWLVWVT